MKVYFVKKARPSQKPRKCSRCSHEIETGEPYRFTTPRFGGRRCFCQKHPPRQSDLTGGKLGQIYGIQEGLEDDLASFARGEEADMEASLEEAADEVDSVADEYEDSIQNMPDSLQQSPVAEECQERADACREWSEELRGVELPEEPDEVEVEEIEDPDPCSQHGVSNEDGCDACSLYWTLLEEQGNKMQEAEDAEEAMSTWRDEVVGEVETVVSALQI